MNNKLRQSGLSLIEMSVIIAVIALLVSLSVPAVRAFMKSFETEGGARSMVSAALSSARTIAMKEQKYAGIRFQKACLSRDLTRPLDGFLEAPQYMTFIIHEEPQKMDNLTIGFRAVEGLKPIKLPDTVGVIDISSIADNGDIDEDSELSNATSFSVIFSTSGKLIIHDVRVRNKDGVYQPDNDVPKKISMDDVFNSAYNINKYGLGMFIQDDYQILGLYEEPSRRDFIIYDKNEFKQAYERGRAWSDYLVRVVADKIYINPYMGTIVSQD